MIIDANEYVQPIAATRLWLTHVLAKDFDGVKNTAFYGMIVIT